jgi:hypothetical protein
MVRQIVVEKPPSPFDFFVPDTPPFSIGITPFEIEKPENFWKPPENFKFDRNTCNYVFSTKNKIGNVILPGWELAIRNPECKLPEPPKSKPLNPASPPSPITCADGEIPLYLVFVSNYLFYDDRFYKRNNYAWEYTNRTTEVTKIIYPYDSSTDGIANDYAARSAKVTIRVITETANSAYPAIIRKDVTSTFIVRPRFGDIDYPFYVFNPLDPDTRPAGDMRAYMGNNPEQINTILGGVQSSDDDVEDSYYVYYDDPDLETSVTTPVRTFSLLHTGFNPVTGVHEYKSETKRTQRIKPGYVSICSSDGESIDPPPPPKKECCKHMACCPDNSNLEQLLKLILKRIGEPEVVPYYDEDAIRIDPFGADLLPIPDVLKPGVVDFKKTATKKPNTLFQAAKFGVMRTEVANRLIGIGNYPISVPKNMVVPFREGIWENIFDFMSDAEGEKKISTLAELIAYTIEQDNAVMGQFHQVIEFENGEEKNHIVLPNVAETLKELILLTTQAAEQLNTLVDVSLRTLNEAAATKVQASRAATVAVDIQDFLDYPTDTKVAEVPLAINIPQPGSDDIDKVYGIDLFPEGDLNDLKQPRSENLDEFLQEGKGNFVYEDWNGKNSLRDQMIDLLQMAAMLRTMLYQKLD